MAEPEKKSSKLESFYNSVYKPDNSKVSQGDFLNQLTDLLGIKNVDALNYVDPVDRYKFMSDPTGGGPKKIEYKPGYYSPDFEPTFRNTLKTIGLPTYMNQPNQPGVSPQPGAPGTPKNAPAPTQQSGPPPPQITPYDAALKEFRAKSGVNNRDLAGSFQYANGTTNQKLFNDLSDSTKQQIAESMLAQRMGQFNQSKDKAKAWFLSSANGNLTGPSKAGTLESYIRGL